jgi:Putative adhesin
MEKRTNLKRLLLFAVFSVSASCFAFAAEGSFERTLPVSGGVNLQVESGSGSIEVRQGSASELRVTGHIRSNNWFGSTEEAIRKIENNPPIQQSGNDIRIGHIDDPELRHKVSISYEVVAPANTQLHSSTGSGSQEISGLAGPIEINSGSGSLKISDIGSGVRAHSGSGSIVIDGTKGSVFARAGSGSINASKVAGGFDGETGSGHLSLEQSGPGSVRAETGSGSLELRNVHGSLQAQAGSGNIEADGEATGEWVVHTGSGSVQLRLPQNASFDLNAHTGSGSINLKHAVTTEGSSHLNPWGVGRKEVRGKVGGGGVPVEVETGSGNIVID